MDSNRPADREVGAGRGDSTRITGGSTVVHVLYDRDCGFCRWSVARLLRADRSRRLDPVAIQSPEGERLLAGVPEQSWLESAHAVGPDGRVLSGGDAAPLIASCLRGGRGLSAAAGAVPPLTRTGYSLVASNRSLVGKLVGASARERADRLLAERSRPGCG